MAIIEIWVPQMLVVLFLALPLFRPFIKTLWPLDGLVWLPLIAFGLTVGIFLAYGFRPECVPILVFAFVNNLYNLFPLLSSIASRPSDLFRDRGPVRTLFAVVLLGVAAFTMFAFPSPFIQKSEAEMAKVYKINSRFMGTSGTINREYSVRVYGDVLASQPFILLVPPEVGSAASVDIVCTELAIKHFTVVTYFYRDYDLFHKRRSNKEPLASPLKLLRYWRMYRSGARFASANENGKAVEADRRAEIEYLLPRLPSLLNRDEIPPILLAGYGAGGSALAYLVGESDFISRHENVLGAVAIESRLWSSYQPEARRPVRFSMAGRTVQNLFNRFNNEVLPQRVSPTGPLPDAGLPILYLVSGRAFEPPKGQEPYRAVFNALRSSPGNQGIAALAAIESAGPLDYHDYPYTHPIYSFLLPGLKGAEKSPDPISDTTAIIANFAASVQEEKSALLESDAPEEIEGAAENVSRETSDARSLPRYPVSVKLHYAGY